MNIGNVHHLATDRKLELEGVPVEIGHDEEGTPLILYVRRAGGHNRAWQMAVSEIHERLEGEGFEGEDLAWRTQVAVVAERLLAGWSGFQGTDGQLIEYTPELGVELFETVSTALDLVVEVAMTDERYRLAADTKSGS